MIRQYFFISFEITGEYIFRQNAKLPILTAQNRSNPNKKIVQAVQVCREINNDNMAREINEIKNALTETGAKEGVIITNNQEDKLDGIDLIPAWKWI